MFDEKIDVNAILRIVHDRGGVVVRGYQGKVEFAAVVQEIIDQDRLVAFAPSTKTLRKFFNTNGFILVVNEVFALLRNCQTLVAPNYYEGRHLWVVGPLHPSHGVQINEMESTP